MTIGVATRRVVLIGNPNTGKTTLFNALTGLSQRVGNYPGVTVEKKTGRFDDGVELVDLPGTYSLAAQSPDEMLAVDVLLGRRSGEPRPEAAIVIVDASNLRRNLYLVTQIIETGLPTLVALNMIDLARRAGIEIDAPGLSRALGAPVVPVVASRGQGIGELRAAIQARVDSPSTQTPDWEWPEGVRVEVDRLSGIDGVPDDRFLVTRALIDAGGQAETEVLRRANGSFPVALEEARKRIQAAEKKMREAKQKLEEAKRKDDWWGSPKVA